MACLNRKKSGMSLRRIQEYFHQNSVVNVLVHFSKAPNNRVVPSCPVTAETAVLKTPSYALVVPHTTGVLWQLAACRSAHRFAGERRHAPSQQHKYAPSVPAVDRDSVTTNSHPKPALRIEKKGRMRLSRVWELKSPRFTFFTCGRSSAYCWGLFFVLGRSRTPSDVWFTIPSTGPPPLEISFPKLAISII